MKREFLEAIELNGAKLTKEIIDSIMDENGKDVQAGKDALSSKETELNTVKEERDGLKSQIANRDKDIKALQKQVGDNADLATKLTELQSKYDKDTSDLQTRISEQSLNYATEKFFAQFEFTSDLAKKAAIAEFKEQKFKFDDKTGDFLGGKDWVDGLKKANPGAFKTEPDTNSNNGGAGGAGNGGNPYFAGPTGNNTGGNDGANTFNFGFAGVRPAPSQK